MKRYIGILLLAAAGVAMTTVMTRAEIHNGGVDCTNWNGVYNLAGASARDPALLQRAGDTIVVKQSSCNAVQFETNIGGDRCAIDARVNGSRRSVSANGHVVTLWGSWVDGYGKNWIITLTPDPARPYVRHSVREYLLTSFHSIIVQASIQDGNDLVPLATFGDGGPRGSKMREHVDARAVYLLPVTSDPQEESGHEGASRERSR
jgi:hypothetical protein